MSSIRQKELVDVKELINEFSVEELCRNAENYFARIKDSENLLAKPFANSNDAQHLLVEISHLIRGLKLYPYMTILDFGSGTCWASIILNQMDYSVISLDVSLTSLKIGEELKKRYPTFGKKPPHKFMHFNGRKIDLPDESIDRIFGLDAFHHVPNQLEVLSEMARVLKKGGIAGFSEPGPNHSKQPQSQFEVRHFKVVENDILLDDILEKAKKVGFTGMRVCISSTYPLIVPLNEFNNFLHDKKQIKAYLAMTDNRMRNFPTFFLYKGESEIKDSREMEGLIAKIKANNTHFIVKTHETLNIDLQIKNISNKIWLPSGDKKGAVNIGAFLQKFDESGNSREVKELRFALSNKEVIPGERLNVNLSLSDLDTGQYKLEVDLVSEYITWFQSNRSKILNIQIDVKH